jgi:hypothetical protein
MKEADPTLIQRRARSRDRRNSMPRKAVGQATQSSNETKGGLTLLVSNIELTVTRNPRLLASIKKRASDRPESR